jgi:hypothetical protein
MLAITNGEVIIEFMPRVGSVVSFLSDRQTEKGPSTGTVLSCNWKEGTCVISHSDHPGETFVMKKVEVVKFIRKNPNDPKRRDYWGLR